jgi:hypothetical protein
MKKLLAATILVIAAAAGYAQTVTVTPFGNWKATGSTNLAVGANPQVTISPCMQSAAAYNFPSLTANTPIKIVDPNNPTIDEILTPTVIVGGCTATFTTANAHTTPWYIVSGSGGLQEAINAVQQTGVMNAVTLTSAWHAAGWNAATLYALTAGSPYVAIHDTSVVPNAAYRWNGTHYIPTYALLGIANPTIAAGAAAGTAPTVSANAGSSGNVWVANVTTGTATTTGTLFTATVGTAPPSGNANCTIQSVGANVPPAFTVSITGGVITVSVATAPVVSTAYIFAGACD